MRTGPLIAATTVVALVAVPAADALLDQFGVKTSRLYADGRFETGDGRAKLICTRWEPFPEQPGSGYPLVLNTGRTVEHWHTRTKTREVPILERLSPRAWLEMNPRDARQLGLRPHDPVDVVSRRGRVRGVELRLRGLRRDDGTRVERGRGRAEPSAEVGQGKEEQDGREGRDGTPKPADGAPGSRS